MILVALDLETTGLNPQRDQILQLGMLAFDTETGETVGELELLVAHDEYRGDPYALAMNADILRRIAKAGRGDIVHDRRLDNRVSVTLDLWDMPNRPKAVGFNVTPFDLAFLKAAGVDVFHHRAVEVGSLLMPRMGAIAPVTSAEWMAFHAGADVAHTALADCRMARDAYAYALGLEWYGRGQ